MEKLKGSMVAVKKEVVEGRGKKRRDVEFSIWEKNGKKIERKKRGKGVER